MSIQSVVQTYTLNKLCPNWNWSVNKVLQSKRYGCFWLCIYVMSVCLLPASFSECAVEIFNLKTCLVTSFRSEVWRQEIMTYSSMKQLDVIVIPKNNTCLFFTKLPKPIVSSQPQKFNTCFMRLSVRPPTHYIAPLMLVILMKLKTKSIVSPSVAYVWSRRLWPWLFYSIVRSSY